MKILLINKFHYLKGGAERVYLDTKKLLIDKGHQVICFSMKDPRNEPCREDRYFVPNVDFASRHQPMRKALRYLYYPRAAAQLAKLIRAEKPDIAHLHNISHQLSVSILKPLQKAGIPMVQTLHDYQAICPNYKLFTEGAVCERCREHRYYQCVAHKCVQDSYAASTLAAVEMYGHWLFKAYREKIDLFISPSEFLKQTFINWGVKNRIEVINNFLPDELPEPRYDSDDYYLCASRFSREKGVSQLIEAAKDLPGRPLRLIGDGPEKPAIKEYLRGCRCDHIELWGWQTGKNLTELIRGARFVVVPSAWYENYPMIVLEAMALGKPILASALGGLKEMIRPEYNGWLYEPGNVADLRRLIEINYGDTEKLQRLGRNARKTVAENNGSEKYYEKLMLAYENVLAGKAKLGLG